MVCDVDFAAQHLLQALLHLHRQRVDGGRFGGAFGGPCQLFAEHFGLPDVQVMVGDHVIIMSYALMDYEEAKTFRPKVAFPDQNTNKIL